MWEWDLRIHFFKSDRQVIQIGSQV
jgi:hypothetical protein